MSKREQNLFIEFQQNSTDFLKALGELSMKADTGRPATIQTKDLREMAATMELFWDITEKIFLRYEERLITFRMLSATEHAKAVILQNELRDTYNEMFIVRDKIPEVVLKLFTNTALVKKEEFEKDVTLRNKQHGQKD